MLSLRPQLQQLQTLTLTIPTEFLDPNRLIRQAYKLSWPIPLAAVLMVVFAAGIMVPLEARKTRMWAGKP